MSTPITPTPARFTLRDLPLPAKLVVTTFLISVGMGYLWAMAQIHFKHASAGEPMPTRADLVARFSGVPWPLVPKPEEKKDDALDKANAMGVKVPGVKIKTVLSTRCTFCHSKDGTKDDKPLTNHDEFLGYMVPKPQHPKGQLYTVVTGSRKSWGAKSMVKAFFEESDGWDGLTAEEQTAIEPVRETERLAVVAWVEAGAPKAHYEADAFPLPAGFNDKDLPQALRTPAAPLAPAAVGGEKPPPDPWKEAKRKQLSVDALTQSTHAHLLTFSVLWSLTGLTFAFTRYPRVVRTVVAPIVLIAQVIDVWCWWLARLAPPAGPYFALAIMGTGGIVGIGLVLQIILSLWDLYGRTGRLVLILLFIAGISGLGVAYEKVIAPQLQEEVKVANPANEN